MFFSCLQGREISQLSYIFVLKSKHTLHCVSVDMFQVFLCLTAYLLFVEAHKVTDTLV